MTMRGVPARPASAATSIAANWTPEQLGSAILELLADRAMRERLAVNAKRMAAAPGTEAAADAILKLL